MKKFMLLALLMGLVGQGVTQETQRVPERQALRVVAVVHGVPTDTFWEVVKNGFDQGAKDMGVSIEYHAPANFDLELMASIIESQVDRGLDGLIVSIPDGEVLGRSIRQAVGAGIPVISINSGSDVFTDLGVLLHVGQTEYEAGLRSGQRFAGLGATHVVCLNPEEGNAGPELRCDGLAAGLDRDITVLGLGNDAQDDLAVEQALHRALDEDPNIDGILVVAQIGRAVPAVLRVLAERDLFDQISFASFDLSPTILQALLDGRMAFAVDQQQWLQGYLAVQAMVNYLQYGLLPANDLILTGPSFVNRDNAAQVIMLSERGIR